MKSKVNRKHRLKKNRKISKCKFDKDNICQTKKSGGHLGTIKSVNKKYCAKQIRDGRQNRELHFYERNCPINKKYSRKRKICKYIPKYTGICVDDNKITYIMLENLAHNMKNPLVTDIKIGKRGKSYRELIGRKKNMSNIDKLKYFFKVKKDNIKSYIYIMNKYGFRFVSLPNTNMNRIQLGTTQPQKLIPIFFKNDKKSVALKKILSKLKKLNKYIQSKDFDEYSFVGTSLLLIYDNTRGQRDNVIVAMIDFYHYRQSKRMTSNERKYRDDFRQGIKSLINELILFKNRNIKK